MQAPNPTQESPTLGFVLFCFCVVAKYQLVFDPYVENWDDFGEDLVDEAMLPVDRFHLKWQGVPPSLIHRYTTASTLHVYHSNPTV